LTVDTFAVGVPCERKRAIPSVLISGFPDDCEDSVHSAISSLRLHGYYIVLDDYQPNGNISINRERRREILQIVDADINPNKLEAQRR